MCLGHTKEELDEYLREVAGFVPHWNHMTEALVFGLSPDQPEIPKDEVSQVSRSSDPVERVFARVHPNPSSERMTCGICVP